MEEGSDAAADTARPIGITKAKPAEEAQKGGEQHAGAEEKEEDLFRALDAAETERVRLNTAAEAPEEAPAAEAPADPPEAAASADPSEAAAPAEPAPRERRGSGRGRRREAARDKPAPRSRGLHGSARRPVADPGLWMQSSDHLWYEPLKEVVAGDSVELICSVRRNVRHCIVRATGESWTEDGYDGTFLQCTLHEVGAGAGDA